MANEKASCILQLDEHTPYPVCLKVPPTPSYLLFGAGTGPSRVFSCPFPVSIAPPSPASWPSAPGGREGHVLPASRRTTLPWPALLASLALSLQPLQTSW